MLVRQVVDSQLAQFSYLVGCPATGEALIIDPERDVDRYFELAARHRLRLVAAVDTHIHADYLSGLRELAGRGVMVYASREGGPEWQYEWLKGSAYPHRLLGDGDTFTVGNIEIRAVHTPGHTPEHLSYLVRDGGSRSSDDIALASGDFVFVGDVGRPDLLERAAGVEGMMVPSARQQFASIQQRFRPLPEFLQVWPGHGAGSACGKSLGDVPTSTVGYELRTNRSIKAADNEQGFVDYILAGQPEPPLYFARMKRDNRRGPAPMPVLPTPRRLGVSELAQLATPGAPVVLDARSRHAFADGHLPGALLAELDFQFNTVAGSFVAEDTPIVLVVEGARLDEAVRGLVRVGLDRIEAYVVPEDLEAYARQGGHLASMPAMEIKELDAQQRSGDAVVLDVRGLAEFEDGHVPDALHIPHTRVGQNLGRLPRDRRILVHCGSGARAAAVVALLLRHGFNAVHVDGAFAEYCRLDAPVERSS